MLRLLRERGFPASEIVPFASERSAGKTLDDGMVVQPIADDAIRGLRHRDLLAPAARISKEWAPKFAAAGAIVVDNSSAWRMDDEVPLVVSEVNPDALDAIGKGIVANPNCTTMEIMLPLKALHDAFGLHGDRRHELSRPPAAPGRRASTSSPSRSRSCSSASTTLVDDGARPLHGIEHTIHAKPLAFNVVPWLGTEVEGGYTDEEIKLRQRVAQDPRAARPRGQRRPACASR